VRVRIVSVSPCGWALCSDGVLRRPASRADYRVGDWVVVEGDLILGHRSASQAVTMTGIVETGGPPASCPDGSWLLVLRYSTGSKKYFCINFTTGEYQLLTGLNDSRANKNITSLLVDCEAVYNITPPPTGAAFWTWHNDKIHFLMGQPIHQEDTIYEYGPWGGNYTLFDQRKVWERRLFAQILDYGDNPAIPAPYLANSYIYHYLDRDAGLQTYCDMTPAFSRDVGLFNIKLLINLDVLPSPLATFAHAFRPNDEAGDTRWAHWHRLTCQEVDLQTGAVTTFDPTAMLQEYVEGYLDDQGLAWTGEFPLYRVGSGDPVTFVPVYLRANGSSYKVWLLEASPSFLSGRRDIMRRHIVYFTSSGVSSSSYEDLVTVTTGSPPDPVRTVQATLPIRDDVELASNHQVYQVDEGGLAYVKVTDSLQATVFQKDVAVSATIEKIAAWGHYGQNNYFAALLSPLAWGINEQLLFTDTIKVFAYATAKAIGADNWYRDDGLKSKNTIHYQTQWKLRVWKDPDFDYIYSLDDVDLPTEEPDWVREYLLELHNQARGEGNELALDQGGLEAVAQFHSDDMATNNFFDHTGSAGDPVQDRLDEFGIIYAVYGENIGAVEEAELTKDGIKTMFDAWMASEGHRANILNAGFTRLGIGYAYDNQAGQWKFTCDFSDKSPQALNTSRYQLTYVVEDTDGGTLLAFDWGCSGREVRDVSIFVGQDNYVLVTYEIVTVDRPLPDVDTGGSWTSTPLQEETIKRVFRLFGPDGKEVWKGTLPVALVKMTAAYFKDGT